MDGRIEDYALLGDLHIAALVGRDDAPASGAGTCNKRRYGPDTLVLEIE